MRTWFLVLLAVLAGPSMAAELATSFTYPTTPYTLGCNGYWGTCNRAGWWHLGEDVTAPAGTPIYACANGVVKDATTHDGYGKVVIIEHELPSGEIVCSLVGHLAPTLYVSIGAAVTKGTLLGKAGTYNENGHWAPHLHFAIKKGKFNSSSYSCNGNSLWSYGGYTQCDNQKNTWYAPSEFMAHYGAFTYDNNGDTYKNITGGANTNWDYTGTTKTATFNEGETAYALLKITTIRKDHRFQARASKDGVLQWSWNTDWNRVGTGWDKAYFFPGIQNITAGKWKLETLIDVGAGFKSLDTFNITAVRGGTSTSKYTYDQNAFVCTGPITGGAATNWEYTGTQRRVNFNKGDTAYVVAKVTNVKANHQFRIAAYKNGAYQWQWDTGWNNVGAGWDKAYFWAEFYNMQPGNWEARLSINVGNGFEEFDREPFTVSSSSPNYRFDDNGFTTLGPINAGTSANDWVFSSAKPAQATFDPGPAVHLLVRFNDLKVSHRFKVETYKNGAYQWFYETPWNTVNPGEPWKWAYFTRSLFVASTGSWQFRIFIDDGAGYKQVKTLNFSVR